MSLRTLKGPKAGKPGTGSCEKIDFRKLDDLRPENLAFKCPPSDSQHIGQTFLLNWKNERINFFTASRRDVILEWEYVPSVPIFLRSVPAHRHILTESDRSPALLVRQFDAKRR